MLEIDVVTAPTQTTEASTAGIYVVLFAVPLGFEDFTAVLTRMKSYV